MGRTGKSGSVDIFDLSDRSPAMGNAEVVASTGEARLISVRLDAGEALDEHRVHEHAWIVVVSGRVEIGADGERAEGGPGLVAHVPPGEVHDIRALEDAQALLILAPWPGDGHPSERARRDPTRA